MYCRIGDALNLFSFLFNTILAIITTTPDTKHRLFGFLQLDEWFQINGFCVNQSSDRLVATEIKCTIALVGMAILHYVLYGTYYTTTTTSTDTGIKNDQLVKKLNGGIFSNIAHGAGHLFILLVGSTVPSIVLSYKPQDIGYIVILYFFWVGALRAQMTSLSSASWNTSQVIILSSLAVGILSMQYMLQVPANMSFPYSQSIILAAGALDQLLLLPATVKRVDGGRTYCAIASTYLPLFFFYGLEMTLCSTTLANIGGDHSFYDTYLALLPFVLYYTLPQYVGTTTTTTTTTTSKTKQL